jgi:hypothetical protein
LSSCTTGDLTRRVQLHGISKLLPLAHAITVNKLISCEERNFFGMGLSLISVANMEVSIQKYYIRIGTR